MLAQGQFWLFNGFQLLIQLMGNAKQLPRTLLVHFLIQKTDLMAKEGLFVVTGYVSVSNIYENSVKNKRCLLFLLAVKIFIECVHKLHYLPDEAVNKI